MTTMLSLILAFMLSIGGSPAASVNPAGCSGNTGIQVTVDNNRTINRFFDDYREKTASRPISKKILEIPLIKQPKTQIRFRFSLHLKEKLRLMGYIDSMNLYQGFNMNPVNFIDPFGKQHQVTVTPEGAEFERPMTVGEFWETLMEAGVTEEEALNIIAESTYYSKYFWDGSLVDRIKTHKMDLTLTDSEARALGMEYNFTLKGPREQAGRLIRGEFKEFGKAALENLDRAFGDPENAALMFSGGVKTKGAKPYPILNKRGILQWKDSSTGQYTKSPIRLPEGVEWPKGFGDPTKWKTILKDLTAEVDEMKAIKKFYERQEKSKSAGDLWDAIEASIKKSKKTYGDILFEQIEKALKKEKK